MDRRHFLQSSIALSTLTGAPGALSSRNWKAGPLAHLIPSASHSRISVKAIFSRQISDAVLSINGNKTYGRQTDSKGYGFAFDAQGLTPETRYELTLMEGDIPLTDAWPLSTMPGPESSPEHLRLLIFTCAGGHPLMSEGDQSFFLPQSTRRRLLQRGLSFEPHAMIAIGDHVYWDQRTWLESRRASTREYSSNLNSVLGMLDRRAPALGGTNEEILKIVAGEQITPLYGTELRSTPSFFINDDHDYFENDEATDQYVTLPPDHYQKQFFSFVRDHFLPDFLPAADVPSALSGTLRNGHNQHFGALRWGKLSETLMYDCAGFLSLKGETAGLVPPEVERWLHDRTRDEFVQQMIHIPSHPFGWSAGKWREWYPDVVAEEGTSGTVINELLSGRKGSLTIDANKYLWQKGWFLQHQRILQSISERVGSRFIFSGDIHALGATSILKSDKIKLKREVKTFLVGPISSSTGTWPSFARGITADNPNQLICESLYRTREENGFTLFTIENAQAVAEINSCGGHNPDNLETGEMISTEKIYI